MLQFTEKVIYVANKINYLCPLFRILFFCIIEVIHNVHLGLITTYLLYCNESILSAIRIYLISNLLDAIKYLFQEVKKRRESEIIFIEREFEV